MGQFREEVWITTKAGRGGLLGQLSFSDTKYQPGNQALHLQHTHCTLDWRDEIETGVCLLWSS